MLVQHKTTATGINSCPARGMTSKETQPVAVAPIDVTISMNRSGNIKKLEVNHRWSFEGNGMFPAARTSIGFGSC